MEQHGVDAAMRERVRLELEAVERKYDVRVLYACESGRHGWGFASPDSDYDVRPRIAQAILSHFLPDVQPPEPFAPAR